MGMKDEFFKLLKPVADSYSNPRTAALGIIGLMNPGLGAALRYGPEIISMMQGPYQAGGGAGVGARGSSLGGMSGMMPSSLAGSPRGGAGGKTGQPLSDLSQYFQRGRALDDSDIRGNIPTMNQGGLVQQVIADRQRVLDSFTPNPYDQYQYLMDNPATRQAPTDDEVVPDATGGVMPIDPTPATPADTFTNLLGTLGNIGVQSATGGSDPAAMSPLEARIAELMENRDMTQQEAAANQAFASQQGADLNNDGAVTNAEYALFMRSQEPTVSTMPVGDPVPLTPNPMGGGFLSSVFNSAGIQQAIDDAIASMGDRSGGVDAPATAPATPTIPDNLQDRIAALTGGAGTFGGMIPNIDVDRLRELMAELYGGQTPPVRGAEFRPPPPRRIMVDPRMGRGSR